MTSPVDFSPNFLKEVPSTPEGNASFSAPENQIAAPLFTAEILEDQPTLIEEEEKFDDSFDIFKILKEIAESAPASGETAHRSGFSAPQKTVHQFPLHQAAAKGDIPLMQKLISEGHSVNSEDNRSAMPLVWATAFGQKEAVRFLIKAGTNVKDRFYQGENALHLAVEKRQYEIARMLAEAGTSVLIKNFLDKPSPMTLLFTQLALEVEKLNQQPSPAKTKEVHDIIDTLTVFAKNCDKTPYIPVVHSDRKLGEYQVPLFAALTNLAEKFESAEIRTRISQLSEDISKNDVLKESYPLAKNLLSTFPTGNKYQMDKIKLAGDESLTILADGNYKQYTTPLAKQSLAAFCQKLTNSEDQAKKNLFEKVREAFDFASTLVSKSADKSAADEAFARFQAGDAVLLPSQFGNHFIDVILSKNHNLFAIANTGNRWVMDTPGIMLHHIHELDKINSAFMHEVLVNQEQANFEFYFTLKYNIVKYDTIKLPEQEFGNCTWESHRNAVKALMYVEFLNQGLAHEKAVAKSHEYFQEWDNFHNHYILEQYLSHQPILPASALGDIYLEIQKKKAKHTFNEDDATNSKLLAKTLNSKTYATEFKAWVKTIATSEKALLKADFTLEPESSSSGFHPLKMIHGFFTLFSDITKTCAPEATPLPDPVPEVLAVHDPHF